MTAGSVKKDVSETVRDGLVIGAGHKAAVESACDLEAAYDLYGPSLYRYALGVTGSSDDAQDAVQEVFARLARRDQLPCSGVRLARFLFRAARNASITILRQRKRRPTAPLDTDLPASEAVVDGLGGLREAVTRLPVEQREVVSLKVLDEMTFAEIGSVLGISANTAASRYRYAIGKLRRTMEVLPDG
ncbi:MAG: RNA polymerase sigma factor [Armatimonadetes bacterium]|nr:RNA polymerase sigma factor [Armatimonadota bacterium]